MMGNLIPVNRTARLSGSDVEVLAANGDVVWRFKAEKLAGDYFTMTPDEFYATYMFIWVPVEPFATIALAKLGGCRV